MCVTWSQNAELIEIEGVVKRKRKREKWERAKKTKLRMGMGNDRISDMIFRMQFELLALSMALSLLAPNNRPSKRWRLKSYTKRTVKENDDDHSEKAPVRNRKIDRATQYHFIFP